MPIKFDVIRRTLRTDMRMNAIIIKMGEFIHDEAALEGVDAVVVDIEMAKYAKICTRIDEGAGQLDFRFATPQDSPAEVRVMFNEFLATKQVDDVDAMVAAINAADRPAVEPDPNQSGG